MRQFATFAGITALLVAGVALLLDVIFAGADSHHAVAVSAALAVVVQLAAFGVSLGLRRWNVMGAWGLGVAIRFAALAIYAMIGIKSWALAPEAALLSFVIFLFLSTLAEPWLLRSPAPSR